MAQLLFQGRANISHETLLNALKKIDTAEEGPALELQQIKKALNLSTNAKEMYDLIISAWNLLSTKEAQDVFNFRLNKYFLSEQVNDVIEAILFPIYNLLYFGSKGSGSCPLITGPLGVGKTTMLKCIFVILFLMLDNKVVPLFIDYSADWILPSVAVVRTTGIEVPNVEDLDTVLTTIKLKMNKSVVLFIDEIQKLYKKDPDDVPRNIVKQIARIGKNELHYSVCSGSSMFTVRWAMTPTECELEGYDSLNHSVYIATRLGPISDKQEFTELCAKLSRQGDHVDPAVVLAVYKHSGGVGRFFDTNVHESLETLHKRNRQLPIPTVYTTSTDDSTAANAWLTAVLSSMLARIYRYLDDDSYDPWLHSTVHTYRELEELGKVYNVKKFDDVLKVCCDQSILKTEYANVDILRPAVLMSLYAQRGLEKVFRSKMETYAMLGTLTGWCEPGEVLYPSPGHRNERPMLETARVLCNFRAYPICERNSLTNKDTELFVEDFLNVCVVGCANLYGVEGLCLTASSEEEGCFDMTVFQVKTGRLDLPVPHAEFIDIEKAARAGGEKLVKRFKSATVRLARIYLLFTKTLNSRSRLLAETKDDVRVFERDDVLPYLQIDHEAVDVMQEWLRRCNRRREV